MVFWTSMKNFDVATGAPLQGQEALTTKQT